MNKLARKTGKNKGRKALYSPMWCRSATNTAKRNQRKIKAIGKGKS